MKAALSLLTTSLSYRRLRPPNHYRYAYKNKQSDKGNKRGSGSPNVVKMAGLYIEPNESKECDAQRVVQSVRIIMTKFQRGGIFLF